MGLELKEPVRWCAVENVKEIRPAALREALLRGEGQSGFSIINVPAPPRDQTVFKVCSDGKTLVVAAALLDAIPQRILYDKPGPANELLEIYFDRRHDRTGWFRFCLNPDGTTDTTTFLPYPEAYSSSFPLLRLQKVHTEEEFLPGSGSYAWRCRFYYAWFALSDVFLESSVVGFNICRWRGDSSEFSAWNYPSGNGGPDATGFGNLHLKAPQICLDAPEVQINKKLLTVSPASTAKKCGITWQLATPDGEKISLATDKAGNASLSLEKTPSGRYRLFPQVGSKTVEPSEFVFDWKGAGKAAGKRDFTVSVTYDIPDCMMANYYTPQRLSDEMKTFADLGVQRLHWIDYSDAPSFWRMPYWDQNYKRSVKECGDILTCAVKQAHRNGLELHTDFKIFDLGINTFFLEGDSTALELEGRRTAVIPEIAAHPEWTMQTNPQWRRKTALPITKLRIYSRERLPKIDADAIRILQSTDNRKYTAYRGPVTVRQGKVQRPHYRWTPAGKVVEKGSEPNWYVELSGLQLKTLFASLDLGGNDVFSLHQGYLLAEAEDANGNCAPITLATTGHRDFHHEGQFFGKEWPGWNNYTEPVLLERKWNVNGLGMTFQEATNLPTLLEPTYQGTRDIWLKRIAKMLKAGVDGVCIRMYNHHNGITSWLPFAFAPAVVEKFRELYGRDPQPQSEDYEKVRRLRGEAMTQFLRDAKKLCAAKGKKLSVQIESGIETGPEIDCRMQLLLDFRTWMEEGIIDEASLKDWTAQNGWIHEHVLPLARKKGIPIHVISRCINNGMDNWAMEATAQSFTDAYQAGFSGYNMYEAANLVQLTPVGAPLLMGYTQPAMLRACREIRELQEES